MQTGEPHGTWLSVIGTDQHSLWSPKKGQWSKPEEMRWRCNWDLALGMEHDKDDIQEGKRLMIIETSEINEIGDFE